MTRFIETHRERFGVEPICREVRVAPSSYYAARARPLSARRDVAAAPRAIIPRAMIGEPVRRRADTLLRELVEPSGEFTFERREPMAAKGLDGEHVMHAAGWM